MPLVNTLLDPLIARIEVQTAWGPTLSVDDPFKSGGPAATPAAGAAASKSGGGFDVARFMRPKFLIYDRSGDDPAEFAPYGEPGETAWPYVVVGLGLLIGVLSYGTWRGMRKR
jgi:hypothetical protein